MVRFAPRLDAQLQSRNRKRRPPPISSKPIRKTNIDERNVFRRRGLLQEGPRNETGEIQSCKEMLAYRPTNLQIGLAADIARVTKIRWP